MRNMGNMMIVAGISLWVIAILIATHKAPPGYERSLKPGAKIDFRHATTLEASVCVRPDMLTEECEQ